MTRPKSALLTLLESVSYKRVLEAPEPDLGLAEHRPYPFLAVVGQGEMKLALLLAIINPAVGGVLLIGPRGTGKTTAVRSLFTLLPHIEVSDCDESVLPADLAQLPAEEAKYLYPDCYDKYQRGESISHYEAVKLIELPLNARLEDVIGGINERAAINTQRVRVERGILSRADNHLLYIDEVNLLDDQIVDAILDAAAAGSYTVRRGAVAGTYRSRFVLIGSMNPEEGRLRPQILDRFGLRVTVRGLMDADERAEVYRRALSYRQNPTRFLRQWEQETADVRQEIALAREVLQDTRLTEAALSAGLELVRRLEIDSHRSEYTMFEAARAYAAADLRTEVEVSDIQAVAPLALRQRRSEFMSNFFTAQEKEDAQITRLMAEIVPAG
ncbi:MAG: ATP-binding protein [Anaerolineae bacterium]|jgi:magnesium chelatase subunit I|nr:ATP-binding protein [Anaerolineae bacterium]